MDILGLKLRTLSGALQYNMTAKVMLTHILAPGVTKSDSVKISDFFCQCRSLSLIWKNQYKP